MDYIELPINDQGHTLKVILEVTIGDLILCSLLSGIGLYLVIQAVIKAIWRG